MGQVMFGNPTYAKVRVLLVEDNGFVRSLVNKMLHNVGVRENSEATDGSAALEKLSIAKPDVIICDIEMKPVGGIDFLKSLRDSPSADTPVIVLTSHADTETVSQAMALGIDGFLAKPVSIGALKDRLDRALKKRPPAQR